jgi:hypothetical protein
MIFTLSEKLKERNHLVNLTVDDRVTLKCVLEKKCGMMRNVLVWLTICFVSGFCEHGNENSGTIEKIKGNFLTR